MDESASRNACERHIRKRQSLSTRKTLNDLSVSMEKCLAHQASSGCVVGCTSESQAEKFAKARVASRAVRSTQTPYTQSSVCRMITMRVLR